MMDQANLPWKLWPEIVQIRAYLKNLVPSRALEGKTPYEVWYGRKSDLSHLRVVGCTGYYMHNLMDKGHTKIELWAY
jgi:hypothetical protein